MNKFSALRRASILLLFCAAAAIATHAQTTAIGPTVTFTTLHNFDTTDGANPAAPLVQGTNGSLYGSASSGGVNNFGTIFKIVPSGTLITVHNFVGTDGNSPDAGLMQSTDGNLYGTTVMGGVHSYYGGTVFKIADGILTTLYSFCAQGGDNCTDGAFPFAGVTQGTDGNFYGATALGGAYNYSGSIFEITPSGMLTTLYSFCPNFDCKHGQQPIGTLLLGTDGNFYGTTRGGGTNNCPGGFCGTIFKITPSGPGTLYSFCSQANCADGVNPQDGLIQGVDGNFYGTTSEGGAQNCNGEPYGCGTVFQITPGGTLTTLHTFDGTDGDNPGVGLVQATNGNFYGTTSVGGGSTACAFGCGTVFEITPGGTLTTLHMFDGTDGTEPAGLVQDTNGVFYGTAVRGGANGDGTIFSLSTGLRPFVKTLPTTGTVGSTLDILGSDLAGATSVTFNGTAAMFTVKSKSEITTTVPAGATTGKVRVATPGGTLSSNVPFRVLP